MRQSLLHRRGSKRRDGSDPLGSSGLKKSSCRFHPKRYKSHLPRVFVAVDFPTSFWGYSQWIGLRENLPETIDLTTQYGVIWGFPVNFPLNQSIDYRFSVGKTLLIWLPGRHRWRFVGALWWKQLSGAAVLAGRNLVKSLWEISDINPHGNPPFYHFPMVKSTIFRFYWCTLWLCQQFANLKMAQSK